MSALYEQARAKAIEIVRQHFQSAQVPLDQYEQKMVDAAVSLTLELVEQEARRRAAHESMLSDISMGRESAFDIMADFCRSQRGTT